MPDAPDGFQIQLSTDAATYTFSIKDTQDACHAAVFSDQAGIIYTGIPIRCARTVARDVATSKAASPAIAAVVVLVVERQG